MLLFSRGNVLLKKAICFSIGSLGEDGATSAVEEVRVQDCHLKGTMYGARIKTWQVNTKS